MIFNVSFVAQWTTNNVLPAQHAKFKLRLNSFNKKTTHTYLCQNRAAIFELLFLYLAIHKLFHLGVVKFCLGLSIIIHH